MSLHLLLDQPYLIAPFAAYLVAQIGKFGLRDFHGERDLPYLYRSGGMPSAHSAVVMALATVVGVADGFYSTTFAIALWLAGIVIYDALGVRRTTGEQTIAIRQLQEHVKFSSNQRAHHMHDAKGHTLKQVVVGALLGVAVGLCFTPHLWGVHADWLTVQMNDSELLTISVIYMTLLIVAAAFYWTLLRLTTVSIKMKKAVTYGLIIPLSGGLIMAWAGVSHVFDSITLFYILLPLLTAASLTFIAASHITIERVRVKPKKSSVR